MNRSLLLLAVFLSPLSASAQGIAPSPSWHYGAGVGVSSFGAGQDSYVGAGGFLTYGQLVLQQDAGFSFQLGVGGDRGRDSNGNHTIWAIEPSLRYEPLGAGRSSPYGTLALTGLQYHHCEPVLGGAQINTQSGSTLAESLVFGYSLKTRIGLGLAAGMGVEWIDALPIEQADKSRVVTTVAAPKLELALRWTM